MTSHTLVLYLVCALWIAGELRIGRLQTRKGSGENRDAGTLRLLLWVIAAAMLTSGVLAATSAPRIAPWLAEPMFWIGIVLMLTGLAPKITRSTRPRPRA